MKALVNKGYAERAPLHRTENRTWYCHISELRNRTKAIDIAQRVRDVHREARFELKQWTSNSKRLLTALNETSEQKKSIDLHTENSSERVLGLNWNSDRDELTFNLNLARLPHDIMNSERPTKRQVLKIVMSLFDPLGLASPVTTKAKQLLQEIWRRDIQTPPHYSYTFVDASETAYAAALYWRATDSRGHVSTSLIIAKSRVAPLKITSIPRLELQAAVMGTRMATTVIEEHDRKPNTKFYWTDSKTVLTWLKNGARSYKPFVAHRIAAIEENSTLNEWRWNRPRRRLNRNAKHPPILSGDHHITRLYIEHTHRQLHHAGAEATINECRQRYYITRIRTVTRYNKAVYSVPNKESVPRLTSHGGPPLEQVGTSPTPVHLHGDRLLRAANSENRSNYE
ncbi:hypothetical protein EVAR_33896_1 [Eumeta japonica]|uniref:Uncharacterized protein n=1 Tax=Eumeta variegata TaxID=151549 RepID=A0A4C1WLZ9_EUMVA|nr:hypothetical protein EVAR_33896_1 [Eumeta japonica]